MWVWVSLRLCNTSSGGRHPRASEYRPGIALPFLRLLFIVLRACRPKYLSAPDDPVKGGWERLCGLPLARILSPSCAGTESRNMNQEIDFCQSIFMKDKNIKLVHMAED